MSTIVKDKNLPRKFFATRNIVHKYYKIKLNHMHVLVLLRSIAIHLRSRNLISKILSRIKYFIDFRFVVYFRF